MFRTLTIERKVLELSVRIVCVESGEEIALFIHLLKEKGLSVNRSKVYQAPAPFPELPVDVLWHRRVGEWFPWMMDIYGCFYSMRYTYRNKGGYCKRSEVKDAQDAFKQALEKAFPKNAFKASNWQKVK